MVGAVLSLSFGTVSTAGCGDDILQRSSVWPFAFMRTAIA